MALSLTAEQKDILKIFKIEEQYVVPTYQRPYSWEYDQCIQLYNDLQQAYKDDEDYFIGNLIIAKSDSNKGILEIIDGQQRLTTLLLIVKVCSVRVPDFKILRDILFQEDWEGKIMIPRIKSEIFEASDGSSLLKVLNFSEDDIISRLSQYKGKNGYIIENKCESRFEANLLNFYNWIVFFETKNDLKKFISFFLKRVFLLPIELSGRTQDEANEKALVIFETINNRGMNLEDADIFKAKLFRKAKKISEEEIFIEKWKDFKNGCEKLNIKIDDVFRYYSHIIRGKQGITTAEKNLREFFNQEAFSPFELNSYSEVMDDLFKIISILELIKNEENNSKWLQLIDLYTNQYPKFAIVTYLFLNGDIFDNNFEYFLESLVRYIYYQGSTTTVKFEIYNIIKQICNNNRIPSYKQELNKDFFNKLGRLKNGFALLAYYVEHDTISFYTIDRIINLNDSFDLPFEIPKEQLIQLIDSLGNLLVLKGRKKSGTFRSRVLYYQEKNFKIFPPDFWDDLSIDKFEKRDEYLKQCLINFFKEDYKKYEYTQN